MSSVNLVRCAVLSDWRNDFSQCLFEWQGLEGGGLALLAALIGSILLYRQIRQAKDHRLDDLNRRHAAAKLTMPLALSGVSEAVQKMANDIAEELETHGPDGMDQALDLVFSGKGNRKRFDPVEIPSGVVKSFERFVETLSNPSDIKHVSELVGKIQILFSNFNNTALQNTGAKLQLEFLLADAATVKALNDGIFRYARNVDQGPFGIVGVIPDHEAWGLVEKATWGLVFGRSNPDQLAKAVDDIVIRYKESGASPWLARFNP